MNKFTKEMTIGGRLLNAVANSIDTGEDFPLDGKPHKVLDWKEIGGTNKVLVTLQRIA